MYQNTEDGANAFRNNVKFTGPNSRVEVGEENGFPIVTVYSYKLKVGEKRGGALNGTIRLLPIPGKGAAKEQGGSKTSRSLIRALWTLYPSARTLA